MSNALKIVEYLANHPQVEAVHHPSLETESTYELYKRYLPNGGGSIFTFEIKEMRRRPRHLSISCLSFPAGKCSRREISGDSSGNHHSQPVYGGRIVRSGIKPNTIRLSIGIEKVEDLIADLDAAFKGVK